MEECKLAIGIDIGGTNTKLGLVESSGKLLKRINFSTNTLLSYSEYQVLLSNAFNQIKEGVPSESILGVGLGVPGANGKTGCIPEAANIPFLNNIPLKSTLEKYWNLPVFLAKDANAAALGEMLFGSAKGMQHFILLTLGTGLGSGVVANGNILTGANGLAAEYGHSLLVKKGRMCNCGQRGCFETYVSATGLKRTAISLLAKSNQLSILRDILPNHLNAFQISDAAKNGDDLAKKAIKITAHWLGLKMVDLVVLNDPEAIILAGGLTNIGDYFLIKTKESLEKHLLPMFKDKVKIEYSSLGSDDAVILGAAALAMNF